MLVIILGATSTAAPVINDGVSTFAPSSSDQPTSVPHSVPSSGGSQGYTNRKRVISVEAVPEPRRFLPPSVTYNIMSNVLPWMPEPAERWKGYCPIMKKELFKKSEKLSESSISRKPKTNEASKKRLNENKKSISKGTERPDSEGNQSSLGEKLFTFYHKDSKQINSGNKKIDNVANNTLSVKPSKKLSSASPVLDADSEKRLVTLFKEASSTVTLENVIKDHKFSSTHTSSLKSVVEKTITVGRLEGSVEAVRTALKMLENGGSIRDAEAVCGPDVLNQIFKWKVL